MPDTKTLAEALNKLQAELKPIRRNTEGQVGQRKRKYADLAAVAIEVYPLLGKYGLSFSAKPTLNEEGRFVLAYKLRHVSGEEDPGDWPLNGGTPQQVGSEITYARRYCLCAVTGAVPEGEDDDGDEAQGTQQDWRNAPVVKRPKHTDAEHERLIPGQNVEDRANGKKAERIKGRAPDDEWTTEVTTDQAWLDEITKEVLTFKSDDYGRVLWRRVTEKAAAQGCTQADSDKLRKLIQARHKALEVERQEVPADAS